MPSAQSPRILYIEPFEAGSHARFTRTLTRGIDAEWTRITLPGRHWKWRMRGAAPWIALARRDDARGPFDLIWASSFVNLAEVRGLLPHLADVPAILHFHENQFAYPERTGPAAGFDLDFGWIQMVSATAATRIVFTSEWNRRSFLEGAERLLARLPDAVPPGWVELLRGRSCVLPVPLDLPAVEGADLGEVPGDDRSDGPVVLWNHRWEHDKAPETFFAALFALAERGVPFRVIVCGESFRTSPPIFAEARARLGDRVLRWGHAAARSEYEALLRRAHIAVSTARQEFFGIALLEAVWFGARPLAPRRLSYPELLPAEHLYDGDLVDPLGALCAAWADGDDLRADRRQIVRPFHAAQVLPHYESLIRGV